MKNYTNIQIAKHSYFFSNVLRKFFLAVCIVAIWAVSLIFTTSFVEAQTNPLGSIMICNIIVDENNNIVSNTNKTGVFTVTMLLFRLYLISSVIVMNCLH